MNEWVKKSIELAEKCDYLDRLSSVYPVVVNPARKLNSNERAKIANALTKRNNKLLIDTLLGFDRFPIDDPYIGFFS